MSRHIKLGSCLRVRQSGQGLLSCEIQGKALLSPGSREEAGAEPLKSLFPHGKNLQGRAELTAEPRIHGRRVDGPAEQENADSIDSPGPHS